MIDDEAKSIVRKLALKNALEHDGKARADTVVAKLIGLKPELRKDAKTIVNEIKLIVDDVNMLSVSEQKAELEITAPELLVQEQKEQRDALPPLPNAEMGKVVTRFPPEPNGYPHIGHAKAVIIDEEYAKMYSGRFILRFDDTNPLKEKLEYYDAIRDGIEWLGVKPHVVKNTSDDMDLLYRYAKNMIEVGGAYVCTCAMDTVRENRKNGVTCECRSKDLQQNLERWKMMFNEYETNQAIVRYSGDMQSENTVMRDPTLFRIIDVEHPLKGAKYRVWPTYDFAVSIEDSMDGVTHAMRTKEYELRNELYYAIIDKLQIRKPVMIEFSRLEFDGMPVSKRKIKPLIDQGLVKEWDDPRMPTLLALKRRGILPEAIREFVLTLGFTKADTKPPFGVLESINRKMIDPVSIRLFFVNNPVKLHIRNAPKKVARIKNHPDTDMGVREVSVDDTFYISADDAKKLRQGSEVRLINLYNIKIDSIEENKILGSFNGDELKEKVPKIQWVGGKDAVQLSVMIPTTLYIGEEYNPKSLEVVDGYAESHFSKLRVNDRVQLVRFGFCRIDSESVAVLTHR
ncbi:MAG: glutamate--tRNA ligase [Nitrososphaerales archaeon]